MTVSVQQLRAFVATLDAGSFTAAAAVLGVGQSAVSHAVAGLEREVGGPVVRRGAVAAATPLGDRLLAHARSVLASVEALEAVVRPATARGTVRLAAVPTVCQGLLPRLRELWAVTLPDVDVQVYEGDDDEMPEWLEAGTVDAAVLVDPSPVPEGGVVVATTPSPRCPRSPSTTCTRTAWWRAAVAASTRSRSCTSSTADRSGTPTGCGR
jgi:DNA-binding transcriptional LysR family regulator